MFVKCPVKKQQPRYVPREPKTRVMKQVNLKQGRKRHLKAL